MHQRFSIEESIRFGWQKTKEHSRLVFSVVLTLFALQILQSVVGSVLKGTAMGVAASIVLFVVNLVISIGASVIALRLAQGKHTEYGDLLPEWKLLWTYVVVSAIVGLIVVAGFIALIIPGIYLALRFSMTRFAVIDGAEIGESLRKSTELTEGVKWELLGFFIVMGVLNILGALLLLVGLLVTLPVSLIAYAHVYQKLSHSHHGHHVEAK